MKKTVKTTSNNSWLYDAEKKQQKKQHKHFRDTRKSKKNVWLSVAES